MTKPFILRSSIATFGALVLTLPLAREARAATTDTYDGNGPTATATGTVNGLAGPPPSIFLDGTNNVLRLLAGVNGEFNRYSYDQTDPGLWETITAAFDFRIQPSTAGLADGFHFMLVPTADFGTTGDGPAVLAEEPNQPNAFAVGVDVYPGINDISAHFNNLQITETAVPTVDPGVPFRSNGVFNRVALTLQRVGNATNAMITVQGDSLGTPGTPFVVMNTVIPNMLPYENRVQFGGRTGGENMILDLDNLNVTYANAFDPASVPDAPASSVGHLYQDFDSRGTTSYAAVNANPPNETGFRPGPLIKPSDAGSVGSFIRIVNDATASQNNRVVFHRAPDGGASNATEVLDFDLRFNSTDSPADGLGLLFLPTRDPVSGVYSANGDGLNSSEEPNHPGALGIGFDIYSNGATDPAPSVSLHWDGLALGEFPIDPSLALNQFNHVQVVRETVNDGLNVTVIGTPNINGAAGAPITVIDHVFVQGASIYDYRVQLSGRTGGLDADVDIDNIRTSQVSRAPIAHTQADFSVNSGSGWKGYAYGDPAAPAPEIRNDATPNGNYLHLSNDTSNGTSNAVAFDQQLDGVTAGKNGITADFNARVVNIDGATAADGFSIMLIPVSVYGKTGPGAAATAGFIAEEPNVPGVFGVAFDAYNGGPQFSELSVHWDGVALANVETVTTFGLDLVNADFVNYHIDLRANGPDALVDLVLTPNIYGVPGAPITVFDDLLIPGMNLYDYRVEFAARTGGLNLGVDLDDINVQTIPEPTSVLLVGLGGLLLARRNRKNCNTLANL